MNRSAMKSAVININTNVDNQIVAAPTIPDKQIGVRGLHMMSNGTVNATFKTKPAGAGTALTGPYGMVATGQVTLPITAMTPLGRDYWFITNPGDALVLTLDQSIQVSGVLDYEIIG